MPRSTQLRSVRRLASALLVGGLGAGLTPLLVASGSDASPASISGLRAEAQQIAVNITTTETKIEILSEQYDQAAGRVSSLDSAQKADQAAFVSAESKVNRDSQLLHTQAVEAYVNAGSSSGLSGAFSSSASSLPVQQTYMAAAAGNLNTAMATLHNSEITLSARRATLATAHSEASANADALASARSNATALESQLENEQANVTGNLRAAVAQEEAAAQAQAQAAAAAEARAAAAATQASGGDSTGSAAATGSIVASGSVAAAATPSAPTPSGSGSGSAAVHAAETQSGVPYVWAGATPGSGFDCSGLTMWAWGQAGVSLPHSAQAQYDSIEHVSASQLEPGDLIFYASGGYIYHVVMYIGGGEIIQAEDTGTVIHTGPIPGGAYGYGRP